MWSSSFSRVPGLADQVEKGELASDETRALVERYVRPIVDKGGGHRRAGMHALSVPAPIIQEVAGPGVDIIDPATPVARELRRRLECAGLLNDAAVAGTERFWTTGAVEVVGPIVRQLWGPTQRSAFGRTRRRPEGRHYDWRRRSAAASGNRT